MNGKDSGSFFIFKKYFMALRGAFLGSSQPITYFTDLANDSIREKSKPAETSNSLP